MSGLNTGKKTVIQVYVTKTKTTPHPQGLADFIRGTMMLHQLSLELGFDLIVDFSHHPLDTYIERMDSEYIGKQSQVLEFFYLMQGVDLFLDNLKVNTVLYVYTNCFPKQPVTQDTKDFIKSTLNWKPIVHESLESRLSNAPKEYTCLHIRLQDEEIFHTNRNLASLCWKIDNYIFMKSSIIVVANNQVVCKAICDRYKFFYIESKPSHTGFIYNGDLKDTVLDFVTLTRAKDIFSWSPYGGSGFSDIVHQVYDIPLCNISGTVV